VRYFLPSRRAHHLSAHIVGIGGWDVPWKTVSISTIIAAIPVMIGVNHAYENWHEEFGNARWAAKQEFQLAQATMAENSAKLDRIVAAIDGMQVQTAITAVGEFERQLDWHMATQRDTAEWVNERNRLTRQLERAREYKQCLVEQRQNCDQLRGW